METSQNPSGTTPSPSQCFFQYFQLEATALQQQMEKLESLPTIGGERLDGIEHCLAGISHLQKEVQDASSYTTAYDQKMYSEGIKALHEKFEETKKTLAPKPKFSFKSVKKNDSAMSLNDAAELAMQQQNRYQTSSVQTSGEQSPIQSPAESVTDADEPMQRRAGPLRRDSLGTYLKAASEETTAPPDRPHAAVRQMSFASANEVHLSSHTGLHIILPSSAAHATSSGLLDNIRRCIVDMSVPTTSSQPFAALTIRNARSSLLICGNVNGASHITGVDSSIILVRARQFRMHQCRNCVVYLHVQSDPIIEDCSGIKFAPLPQTYVQGENVQDIENRYDKVQDFKWLKAEHSPNWSLLPEEEFTSEKVWTEIARSGSRWSLEEIFKETGLTKVAAI